MKKINTPRWILVSLEHRILSREETRTHIARAQAGDKAALEHLLRHNQRAIFKIALAHVKFTRSMDMADLMQEGNIGLMRAIQKFDLSRETSFVSYMWPRITGVIRYSIRKADKTVRLPDDVHTELRKLRKFIATFEEQRGRSPTMDELPKSVRRGVKKLPTRILAVYLDLKFLSLDKVNSWMDRPEPMYASLPCEKIPNPFVSVSIADEVGELTAVVDRLVERVYSLPLHKCRPRTRDAFFHAHGLQGFEHIDGVEIAKRRGVEKQGIYESIGHVWKLVSNDEIDSPETLYELVDRVNTLRELATAC